MRIIPLITLLFSLSSYAKIVELKVQSLWVDGELSKESSSSINTALGEPRIIPIKTDENLFLKITPSQYSGRPEFSHDPQEILLQTEIIEVKNGNERVLSRPEVITVLGKNAVITRSSIEDGSSLKLTILPVAIR